jgi:hypothetical protein
MVVIQFPRRPGAPDGQDVASFIRNSCRQFSIDEGKIFDLAHAIAGSLTPQYAPHLGPEGGGYIAQIRQDEYVLGYIMGYVVAASGEAGYSARSRELLLCWLLVIQKVFGMSLHEATELLERCQSELETSGDNATFGRGITEGAMDRDSFLRGAPTQKLMAHLMKR